MRAAMLAQPWSPWVCRLVKMTAKKSGLDDESVLRQERKIIG